MNPYSLITLLTDFGYRGGYVAACEAVIASIAPGARVAHVCHEGPIGDVREAATTLARVAPLFPPAIHVAMVDPGVGTSRLALIVAALRGDLLVGPDNGLLVEAIEALGGSEQAWAIDASHVDARASGATFLPSSTFHGRDVFAPAAAFLMNGAEPRQFGPPVSVDSLVRLPSLVVELTGDRARAQVLEIDRFGNVALALRFDVLPPFPQFEVELEGEGLPVWTARVVRTYAELKPAELGLYTDSWGQVALTLNGASAAELLGIRKGAVVVLRGAALDD
jgi:S-adenosyl-L-methionine hydrolase (adenosine-forming)